MVFGHDKTTIRNVNWDWSANKTSAKKILLDVNELQVLLFPTTCLCESESQRESVMVKRMHVLYVHRLMYQLHVCVYKGSTSVRPLQVPDTLPLDLTPSPMDTLFFPLKVAINLPAPGLEMYGPGWKMTLRIPHTQQFVFLFFFPTKVSRCFQKVTELITISIITIATGL